MIKWSGVSFNPSQSRLLSFESNANFNCLGATAAVDDAAVSSETVESILADAGIGNVVDGDAKDECAEEADDAEEEEDADDDADAEEDDAAIP